MCDAGGSPAIMASTTFARVPAFAKINLALHVLGKRPDNYHEIRTVFQTISLYDSIDIEFQRARVRLIEIAGNVDIPNNLILRAAEALLDHWGIHAGIRFRLTKRIPLGGGLGGGSSDAAAVLLALPVLARKRVAPADLLEIAARLGSDVPFFLLGGTALGLGRGEELYPFPEPKAAYGILVAPDVHVSTPEAYGALGRPDLTSAGPSRNMNSFQSFGWSVREGLPVAGWAAGSRNDFEPVVFRLFPPLASIKRKLLRLGAKPAMLSGSGAALFGFFESRQKALAAAPFFTGEKVFPISLVSRARYRSLWKRALGAQKDESAWPPQSRYA
jgi:4-diphosphocytidyl-2-C-methyl-D-erythritol kinase